MKMLTFEINFKNINQLVKLIFLGFGDHIKWYTLDEALVEAKSTKQPVMVIVHKTWCGACKGTY